MTSALFLPLGAGGKCPLLRLLPVDQGRTEQNTGVGAQIQEVSLDAEVPHNISKSWRWGQAWRLGASDLRWLPSSLLLSPCHYMQSAGVTLPTDSRVTALVPSESAIRRLSPNDQAFWLQPRALPQLVRWAAREGPGVGKSLLGKPPPLPRGLHPVSSASWGGAQSQRSLLVTLTWFHAPQGPFSPGCLLRGGAGPAGWAACGHPEPHHTLGDSQHQWGTR